MDPNITRENTPTEKYLHEFRTKIDENIKFSEAVLSNENCKKFVREMSLVRTKLQEAKMWTGKCLEAKGAPFPESLRDEATTEGGEDQCQNQDK